MGIEFRYSSSSTITALIIPVHSLIFDSIHSINLDVLNNELLVFLDVWKQYVQCHCTCMDSELYVCNNYKDIDVFIVVIVVLPIGNVMHEMDYSGWFSTFRPNWAII
jgi:hypothetical protein